MKSLFVAALFLLAQVSAVENLDAFVKIKDKQDKAGESGTYLFTVELKDDANTEIQTYFPSNAVYSGDHSKPPVVCE
jgi:hypothetical protein